MALYTTRDHRGRTVDLNTLVADRPASISVDTLSRDVTRRIEARLGTVIAPNSTATSVAYMGVGALFAAGGVVGARHGLSLPLWIAIPVGIAASLTVTIVVAAALRGRFGRARAEGIAEVFLAERLCPACGYDLGRIPRDQDELTVCPECGAAWQVPSRA